MQKGRHTSPLTGDALTDGEMWLFNNPNVKSTPHKDIYRDNCYICRDPDFAQMGLPLCRPCSKCKGHVPADDVVCTDCGADQEALFIEELEATTAVRVAPGNNVTQHYQWCHKDCIPKAGYTSTPTSRWQKPGDVPAGYPPAGEKCQYCEKPVLASHTDSE